MLSEVPLQYLLSLKEICFGRLIADDEAASFLFFPKSTKSHFGQNLVNSWSNTEKSAQSAVTSVQIVKENGQNTAGWE